MENRINYLYHSFPRRKEKDKHANYLKGECILNSILKYGLLLTPEQITWVNHWPNKGQRYNFTYIQNRVCFTELPRNELSKHSRYFGNYAIEFTIDAGRSLGAIPVFYIPIAYSSKTISDIGIKMIHNLGHTFDILNDLSSILKIEKVSRNINITHHNQALQCSTKSANILINSIFENRPSPSHLAGSLHDLLGHYYPMENLEYTKILGYYMQHEWRISGKLRHYRGQVVVDLPTRVKKELLSIDYRYFTKVLEFEGCRKYIDDTLLYQGIVNKKLNTFINRIFCPKQRVIHVRDIVKNNNLSIPVLAIE